MTGSPAPNPDALGLPAPRLVLGITGHREGHPVYDPNAPAIAAAIEQAFALVDATIARHSGKYAPVRLVSPLASGADHLAARVALAHGWELSLTLPFGASLNAAIQAGDTDQALVLSLARGEAVSGAASAKAAELRDLPADRRLELAEQDETVLALVAAAAARSGDAEARKRLTAIISQQSAAAARVMVDQIDLLVAVWDGSEGPAGGTQDTIAAALARGVPVWWIDARAPDTQILINFPEELERPLAPAAERASAAAWLEQAIAARASANDDGARRLHAERWRPRSPRFFSAYRWIEDRFAGPARPRGRAGRRLTFEAPDAIVAGSFAPLANAIRALPGLGDVEAARIEQQVVRRFAYADGISTWLADPYRGGMTLNFALAALAIVSGVAYLPLTDGKDKWPFALAELLLLLAIVAVTLIGRRQDWHGRWMQTRRVAEYLRHAPILLLLGVSRPAGRWPVGRDSGWPERYARDVLREAGAARLVITQEYLRALLGTVLRRLMADQIGYHRGKAAKLAHVHHGLDRVSEWSFRLALVAVAGYLVVEIVAALDLTPHDWPHRISKIFTFLGVFFPTLGGALAGIRYFGDFERFAAISEATAGKLAAVLQRIGTLLAAPDHPLAFSEVADLAVAVDEIVVAEIESWQSVFATKVIAVPG